MGNILSSGMGINQTGLDEVEDCTGYNYDKVMNKYFVQYRMYDASSKRFITQDTNEYINIYDAVSINKYVYANNNPTNYVDYNGHEATTPENEFGDSLETRMYMEDGSVISDKTLEERAEFAFAMNSIYLNLELIGLLAMMVPGAGSLIMASIFMPIILWNSLENLSYMMQTNQMRIDYAAGNYESDGGKHALRESFGDTAYEVITMVVMTVEITAVVQQTAKAVSGALANKLLRSGSVVDDAVSASLLSKMDDVKVKGNSKGSTNDVYAGVKEASAYLKEQGIPRKYRKQILESFTIESISMDVADSSTYGIRFFDDIDAKAKGRYLFETFTNETNRYNLALPYEWNHMTNIQQWKIQEGTLIVKGIVAPQTNMGAEYVGGATQWYINNLANLIIP